MYKHTQFTSALNILFFSLVFNSCIRCDASSITKDSLASVFKNNIDEITKADAAMQLATLYTNRAIYDSSEFYLKYAYQTFINLNDERNIMNCYMQYGILESYKGNYTLAANYLLRTLIYAEKTNDNAIYSAVYINLASVYSALEEYKKAKYYILKVNKADLEANQLLYVNYLGNLAQLEYELANYKNALSYLRTGIEILDDYPVDINLIQFYIIAGDCAYQLKEFDLSLGYYNKANINIDKNTLPLQYAHLTHGLAKLFKSTKSNIALNYANTSMEFAQLHQVKDLIIDNYSLQSEIYENLGNKTKALQLLKLHQSYKDSLRLNEINKNIAVLESNYELIKSKSYIEKLQLINEKNILKNLIYLIFVIITIFTSILLFFLLKNRNQINRELKRANLVKDKLLSIISHDLKSPLNNIVTVLDGIAKDDYSKDELELIINSLNNQTLATVDTLDNILQWGKTQLRGIVVNKTILDADSQIQDNIKIHNAQLINKGLTIQYSGINDLKIMFDKDHFDFIIRNFISNAIKFSYENSIVEINIESDEQLDFITISVIDHGVGLQLSEIDTIFSSVPSIKTGTSNEKGTGLALSLSREFAELNGAKIGYSPNPPRGSVFFIKIQNIK